MEFPPFSGERVTQDGPKLGATVYGVHTRQIGTGPDSLVPVTPAVISDVPYYAALAQQLSLLDTRLTVLEEQIAHPWRTLWRSLWRTVREWW